MIELTPIQSVQNLQLVLGPIALGLKGLTRLGSTSADVKTENLRTDRAGSARIPLGRMMTKLLGFSPPPCILSPGGGVFLFPVACIWAGLMSFLANRMGWKGPWSALSLSLKRHGVQRLLSSEPFLTATEQARLACCVKTATVTPVALANNQPTNKPTGLGLRPP